MKCQKCGHTFKAQNQVKGGKSRWAGMSKAQRKQAASAAAKARWAKSPNVEASEPGTMTHDNPKPEAANPRRSPGSLR